MATAEATLPLGATVAERESASDQVSQWRLMWWRFLQNRLSVAGGIMLILMYGTALIAPFVSPYDPNELDTAHSFAEPTTIRWQGLRPTVCPLIQTLDTYNFKFDYKEDCARAVPIGLLVQGSKWRIGPIASDRHLFGIDKATAEEALKRVAPSAATGASGERGVGVGSAAVSGSGGANFDPLAALFANAATAATAPPQVPKLYLMGADQQGRDLFSRILEGSRVSLTIGLVGVVLSLIIGSLIGAASGYLGGTTDNVIQRLIEIVRSMPTIPLWAAIAAALPRGVTVVQRYFLITVVLSLVNWTGLARELRGKVLAYRQLDYIAAARLAGSSHLRTIVTHMLPNAASHIIVVATLAVPGSILGETALSFLGLGMLPPAVSWGVLLKDTQQIDSLLLHPWMLWPALPVIVTVASYFLLGDGLRDAIDPYS
ncbi:MAG TPA: ABC transporter permease [Chloroflexota bacterium]|nr:ABC transporter permease [Chloroflexota bacterium]